MVDRSVGIGGSKGEIGIEIDVSLDSWVHAEKKSVLKQNATSYRLAQVKGPLNSPMMCIMQRSEHEQTPQT